MALSDSAGDTVQTYEYSIYGHVAAEDPNHPNPYLFTGRRFDIETGLYYYRARYYNPWIGRFLQTDPVGYDDGLNWYLYCGNNPVSLVDPSGLGADSWLPWDPCDPCAPYGPYDPCDWCVFVFDVCDVCDVCDVLSFTTLADIIRSSDVDYNFDLNIADGWQFARMPRNPRIPAPLPDKKSWKPVPPKYIPRETPAQRGTRRAIEDEGIGSVPGVKEQEPKGLCAKILHALVNILTAGGRVWFFAPCWVEWYIPGRIPSQQQRQRHCI